jgi:hypothetical protein
MKRVQVAEACRGAEGGVRLRVEISWRAAPEAPGAGRQESREARWPNSERPANALAFPQAAEQYP